MDPTASMGENVWNMAQMYNWLPPELNPLRLSLPAATGEREGGLLGTNASAAMVEASIGALEREVRCVRMRPSSLYV